MPHPVTTALATLLRDRAAELERLATHFQSFEPTDVIGPHRLLALAGPLLGQLADVERTVQRVEAFLPPPRGSTR